jgi:pimeloyl-ACP methyl ester carboxylesterase
MGVVIAVMHGRSMAVRLIEHRMGNMSARNVIRRAVVIALTFVGISSSAFAEVYVPPFYEAVAQMKPEGRLGTVIKREKISTPIAGAQAWRIAYISSDLHDRKVISTGLLVAPIGKAPKDGRPVVSWAHGTTGAAQNCGPSQVTNPAVPLNQYFLVGGNSWTDYGIPALNEFIKEGYVVVASDYQGLGGGGVHQYAIAATQGRDAINAIRAAGSLREVGASRKALIHGWSQGGGATLAAASSGDYINQKGTAFDGVEMVGFVAMAPPDVSTVVHDERVSEATAETILEGITETFSQNVFDFTHLAMNLWATQAAFSEELHLSDLFTDEGVRVVNDVISNKCMHAAADTLRYAYSDNFMSLMKKGATNAKAWTDAILAGAGTAAKPVAPVVIYWGTKDATVPPIMGKLYRERVCAQRGNVARVQLPGEQTHFSTPGVAQPLYVPWVVDRFSGKTAPDGCSEE